MRSTCEECGYEYSAMMMDDEVPDYCECGGKVNLDWNSYVKTGKDSFVNDADTVRGES